MNIIVSSNKLENLIIQQIKKNIPEIDLIPIIIGFIILDQKIMMKN